MEVRSLVRGSSMLLFSAALTLTMLSQLPSHSFDRMRRSDLFGLIPNWKFFAPVPATRDHEVFHRLRNPDGTWQDWQRTSPPAPRRFLHLVWFPGRRADKGVFDHASELAQLAVTVDPVELVLSSSYRTIAATVGRCVRVAGDIPVHQFAIITHAGSDDAVLPEVVLLSPALGSPSVGASSPVPLSPVGP